MAQPTPYVPTYDFTDWQTAHPSDPLPADELDIQLGLIKTFTQEVCTNLALIQRDDGALANDSVGIDQLSSEIDFGFATLTNWATATAYVPRDGVYQGSNVYRCLVAHTSDTFATDLAAGKWILVADFNQFLSAAAVSAAASAASAASSALSSADSAAAAVAANTSKLAAAASATQAGVYAAQAGAVGRYYCTTAGSVVNSYILTTGFGLTNGTLVEGMEFTFKVPAGLSNTSSAVGITVDGCTLKNVRKNVGGSALSSVALRDFTEGALIVLRWNNAQMEVVGGLPPSSEGTGTIASATTIDLSALGGDFLQVSGVAAIDTVTMTRGQKKTLRATGAWSLVNSATLVCPGAANIQMAAGDIVTLRCGSSGLVTYVETYTPISGLVDRNSAQSIAGAKTFSSLLTATGKMVVGNNANATDLITLSASGYSPTIGADGTGVAILHASAVRGFRYGDLTGTQLNIDTSGAMQTGGAAANAQANSRGSISLPAASAIYGINTIKSWATFVGSSAAISASYNVASISRTSAGFWVVTFSTTVANTYAVLPVAGQEAVSAAYQYNLNIGDAGGVYSLGSGGFTIKSISANGGILDMVRAGFAVLGTA